DGRVIRRHERLQSSRIRAETSTETHLRVGPAPTSNYPCQRGFHLLEKLGKGGTDNGSVRGTYTLSEILRTPPMAFGIPSFSNIASSIGNAVGDAAGKVASAVTQQAAPAPAPAPATTPAAPQKPADSFESAPSKPAV